MKKNVLIGSVLLAAISSYSQTGGRIKPSGLINTKVIADMKYSSESGALTTKTSPVKSSSSPIRSASKTSAITTWNAISSSMNIYGMLISYAKPLQWNDELNAVSFIHRKSPNYAITPTPASNAATGGIVGMVSTNCGATWDSTALFANDNFWARYPNGGIYNPAGNTDISNAYIVGAGPTTGTSGGWIGNWYASRKLGAANYNSTLSAVPNAQQVFATTPVTANFPSRHDFAAYSFAATDDGKMRILAGITDDVVTSDTAVMLVTGTFNNGIFDWAGRVFDPPTTISPSDGSENWLSRPIMAWNEAGTIGYVVIIGSRLGSTGSNVGMQPIVYKTINSGSSWTLENSINFNSPAYTTLKDKLWAVSTDTTLVVPNFLWLEGIDASVDLNNKLHIFTSLAGHSSNDPDSLNFVSQWSSEKYLWPHSPIKTDGPTIHPYLYDFIYDGTNATPTWSHMLVDSMSSEGISGLSSGAGYQDNPWDMDPSTSNQKVRIDARLQMSRTPDGKHLLYTWSESDTAFTDQQKKWNNLPNIKARLYDAENSEMSPTDIDVTVDVGGDIGNRAMYQCVSPKFKLGSKTATSINVTVPMTISNSSPYAQLTANTHWFSCAGLEFERPSHVGIAENGSKTAISSSIYPNPAKNNAMVRLNMDNASKVQIDVMNTVGQIVKTVSTQGQTGANNINVDLSGLSSGIYLVNIKVGNASSTKKLIIE